MATGKSKGKRRLGPPWVLAACLWSLAVISVALGLASALVLLYAAAEAQAVDAGAVLAAVLSFAGGCVLGGVLWALAWLCRREHERSVLVGRIATALERLAGASVAPSRQRIARGQAEALGRLAGGEGEARAPGSEGVVLAEQIPPTAEADPLLEEIRELSINVLLSDSQRQMKRRYLTERQSQRLKEEVERAIAAGDLGAADESLDRLLRIAPDLPEIGQLTERVERARSEAEARDVAEATSRVEDLMSVNGFATAEAVVNGLLAKHPSCPEAIALLERVRRERDAFVKDQRLTMYRNVEKLAGAKRWREALAAAEELVSAYPSGPEADAVRVQLETLRENARIEEVRHLRDEVTQLIARRQFAEALSLAKDLMARFPGTAAAHDLREQMDKLEELARAAQGAGP